MCTELPIQCTDAPLYRTPTKESDAFTATEDLEKAAGPMIEGKTLREIIAEMSPLDYGAERPITLCEAFIRKYLCTRKTQVCMQMRRSKEQVSLILDEEFKPETRRNLNTGKSNDDSPIASINKPETQPGFDLKRLNETSTMLRYTWSNFFQQSI